MLLKKFHDIIKCSIFLNAGKRLSDIINVSIRENHEEGSRSTDQLIIA